MAIELVPTAKNDSSLIPSSVSLETWVLLKRGLYLLTACSHGFDVLLPRTCGRLVSRVAQLQRGVDFGLNKRGKNDIKRCIRGVALKGKTLRARFSLSGLCSMKIVHDAGLDIAGMQIYTAVRTVSGRLRR